MIASGQLDNAVNTIVAAARKGGIEAIEELGRNGVLTTSNFHRTVLVQGNKVAAVVKAAVKKLLADLADNIVGKLKRIFADEIIELDASNGHETLAAAKDLFGDRIYGAKERGPCKPTKKTLTAVYEMIENGSYQEIFGGFGENLERLCLTEDQIVKFCRKHRDKLRKEGYATFFLFQNEEDDTFSVAVVSIVGGELFVVVDSLDRGSVWDTECRRRVVVPQLSA
jgi:hypothetical protein